MAALSLHHAIFANEKASDLPLRSASSFLYPAPERDESPTSHLFASAAYQDLIERQPTHPGGPMSGWDLGLNLLGDPITAEEHKNLKDYQTKMKLRRLHAINVAFELLFGIWGTYMTIRYFLAFVDGLGDVTRVFALGLGIVSALVVTFVVVSLTLPLLPQQSRPNAWQPLLRACYLLLLGASPVINLTLVLAWHPRQFCGWDVDISWYTSSTNTLTSLCHPAPFGAWIAAAMIRLILTWAMTLSFIYTLRSYHKIRHPSERNSPKYFSSDAEEISPVSTSSPFHLLKPKVTRSDDHTFNQSNITLPKYNSISTLAPSTSCTGRSHSYATPPLKDIPPVKISPPTSRRASVHVTNHGSFLLETSSEVQLTNVITESSSVPHMLRRKSRVLLHRAPSDTTLSGTSSYLEKFDGQTILREPSEERSCPASRPGHRCAGVNYDVKKITSENANTHAHHASQTSVSSTLFSSTQDGSESIKEKGKIDSEPVYAYGYGVSGPTYPYLDMYNPQRPDSRYGDLLSCGDVNEHGLLLGHRHVMPGGPVLPDVSSEPPSPSGEDESSGEEEEYVAMMGGYVRRMATIESLGSKEAGAALSAVATTPTGSVALRSMSSRMPGSQFSSVQFAEYASSGAGSSAMTPLSREGSLDSTAYLSFSSGGGTGIRVNEHGELLPGPNTDWSAAGSSYDHQYYTASAGGSFLRMDDEDR